MLIKALCRIISLSACLSFFMLDASYWHVLYTATGCSRSIMHTPSFFCKYAPTISTLLKSNGVIQKLPEDIDLAILDEGLLHQIYSYSFTSPEFSFYCTVLPLNEMVTVNVYSKKDAYNRDTMSEFTRNFFCAQSCKHETRYIAPNDTLKNFAPNK